MWIYEKKLIYPMPKLRPDAHMAKLVNALMGGANGEMSAATTYLNQRYCMPYKRVQALLTDIGTEELSHVEMLSAMYTQLICDVPVSELVAEGMAGSKFQHGCCPFPADANGYLWTSAYIGTTGDPVADITNDMAAEEKARAGYEGGLRQCSDPDVAAALQFLREREIVHFQRFGEALNYINEQMGCRKYF